MTYTSSMMENLNITVNETESQNCCSPGYLTEAEKIGKAFSCCLFLVVSLAGNTLIAIIIYKMKTMRTTTNLFILNMALSDLLLPIFVFPLILMETCGGSCFFSGEQGQTFCKMMLLIQFVSCLVSVENLVLIAVDRFGAVVFPFRPPLIGSKQYPFFIFATWVVATAFSSTKCFGYKSDEHTGKFNCEWVWKHFSLEDNTDYLHAMHFVFMVISLTLIITLYCVILFKLKAQKRPGEQSVNAVKVREKRERNVLRMAVAIVTGFVVCWGPVHIFGLLIAFVWNDTTRFSSEIVTYRSITVFMAYANCAVNPCICFAFSGKYRQGLKGILGCH